jgi:2-polyprenyl-3-methyl-5-hydroxy-6-metoxy-1,4-benzoquinol methylase
MAPEPERANPVLDKVLSLYTNESPFTRFHIAMRCRRFPFYKLEKLMPGSGKLADLGCGHGVFSNLLAMTSPQREVLGIDKDRKKIEIAKRTIGERRNISFRIGDLSRIHLENYSGISILGVLYLMPYDMHKPLLDECFNSLAPGGIMLLNTVDPSRRIHFCKSKLLEYTMNMFFRLMGAQSTSVPPRLHPRHIEEWDKMLSSIGFSVQMVDITLPTPGNTFLCLKKTQPL